MKPSLFCAAVGVVVLLSNSCRKEEIVITVPPVPPAMEEPEGAPLSTMSRGQREAHRIRQAVGFLEEALTALRALEQKEQLTWKVVPKPDLAAFAATLTSVRAELAQSEARGTQGFHNKASGRLNDVFQQIIQLSQQVGMPEGAPENRDFASALISASDAMETTSEVHDLK